jgi:WD40 repeat protein
MAEVTLKLAKELGHQGIFLGLARVPNSSRLLLGAADGNVYDVDPLAEKPEFKALAGHGPFVTGVAIAGELLISGGYDCKLLWRKVDGGEIVHTAENAHSRWIRKLAASPDGRLVASVADDMVCRMWEAVSGKLVHELKGHDERTPHHFPSMLYTCAFSPDGQRLATADKTGRICIWDVASGSKLAQLSAEGFYTWDPKQRIHSIGGTRALAFSPDGKTLVAGGIGKIGNIDHLDGPSRVEVFDWEAGTSLHTFEGDAKGLVEQLLFHPEGKWLVGLGGDNGGLVQLYDLAEKKVTRSEKAPMHVHAASLIEDATKLFAAGHGKLAVWEILEQEA